ncbi:nucleotidyltransferase family protein [Flexivirga sp. B27]
MHERTTLPIDVGVELAHALTADVAARHDCRVLFIKGPVATVQDLRPARTSTDVDVWVEPEKHGTLIRALAEHGWRRRVLPDGPRILESHSVTLLHDDWPCDIDVHRYFPGLLAEPRAVFDFLWDRHETVELAGVSIPACDRLAAALVLAAHQLRDFDVDRNKNEYRWLLDRLRKMAEPVEVTSKVAEPAPEMAEPVEAKNPGFDKLNHLDAPHGFDKLNQLDMRADLRVLAGATETMDSLQKFFADLDVEPPAGPTTRSYDKRLHDWRMRSSNNTPTSRWLYTIRRSPWRSRPAIAWRALTLPGDLLDQLHPEVGDSPVARTRARLARLGRGLRALAPSITADIRAGRPPREPQ